MQDYVKDKTAQESFLELASKVSEGEFAVLSMGSRFVNSEGQHQIVIDLIETPKTVKHVGWHKTKDLRNACVSDFDPQGNACGKVEESNIVTCLTIWDKYGKTIVLVVTLLSGVISIYVGIIKIRGYLNNGQEGEGEETTGSTEGSEEGKSLEEIAEEEFEIDTV